MDIDRNDGSICQWEFGNQRSQLWDIELAANGYVYIGSAENGMLLDIAGGNPRDEARLILAPQSGSQSQLWTIDDAGEGLFRITSRFGKCIDVPDASGDNGAYWQLWRPIEKYTEKSRLSLLADVPGGDRDRDHGRRDDDGEARGEKEPTTRAIVLGCRMPALICDAPTRGTTVNSMPTSRTPSSKATTMGTTSAS